MYAITGITGQIGSVVGNVLLAFQFASPRGGAEH
jgi:hypothetical protein